MEHESSFNRQLKKEITARVVMIKKNSNLPSENPFDFTERVEKQKEENEIDLGLFFELAEKNKIIYNQTPVNNLIEDMENWEMAFLRVVTLV